MASISDRHPLKPAPANPRPAPGGKEELEKRIERLEQRLDETLPDDHQTKAIDGVGNDASDPLRRAVERAGRKRET